MQQLDFAMRSNCFVGRENALINAGGTQAHKQERNKNNVTHQIVQDPCSGKEQVRK
ncbi:hypothetical protein HMPREF0083_05093 [Aneurinibacillus aneurinilyticus ATCC 12856]|uniref:Uncharacterized protein n=1 Tax=Aneurinibacillus aneurinilyticus ATCC 12856 TaxID=649747 RepID=U1WX67_ANEAE|nr:hypothetical protein HMPREF0083_05093 [Aneurinibacillus aneurinilyticus ATCC 12856]